MRVTMVAIAPDIGEKRSASDMFVNHRVIDTVMRSKFNVVMISGPAGIGKSVLLGQIEGILHTGGRVPIRRAWSDVAALAKQRAFHSPLIIDDFHLVDTEARDALLETLLHDESGPHILAARQLPALDWLSLESRGWAVRITDNDLRLTAAETAQFLGIRAPDRFDFGQAAHVHAETGGWMLAAEAAAMTAVRTPRGIRRDRDSLVPWHLIDAYLSVNLEQALPADIWALLVRIASFDAVSADLVASVFGAEAMKTFQRLTAQFGLFSGSAHRGSFVEMFRPIRSYLRRRHMLPRDAEAAALERAGTWCANEGAYDLAIDYLLRADKPAEAAALLKVRARHILAQSGDNPKMLDWLDRIAAAGHMLDPQLRLWRAWALVYSLRLTEAEAELAAISEMIVADDSYAQSFVERLFVSIAARRDEIAEVERSGKQWLDRWSDMEPANASGICILLALAATSQGNERGYRRMLLLARQYAVQCGNDAGNLWILGIEAQGELNAGRAQYAAEIIDRAQTIAEGLSGRATPIYALLSVIAARIDLELDQTEAAQRHLSIGYEAMRYYGLVETHLAAQDAMVGLSEMLDGPDTALLNLHQQGIGGKRYTLQGHLLGVRVLVRAGRLADAQNRFDSVVDTLDGRESDHLQQEIQMTGAWLKHASGDHRQALELLAPLLAYADARGQRKRLASLLLLRAACEWALGNSRAARNCVSRGIGIASSGKLMRTVLELSWALRDFLLQADREKEISLEAEKFLLMITDRISAHGGGTMSVSAPLERLTPRELQVAALLDSGMKGGEIAEQLGLNLTTYKWHLRNIYGKLNVRNRTGAVSAVRRLGLA